MSKRQFLYSFLRGLKRVSINLMFWGWNLLFVFMAIFLLIPYVLIPLIQSTFVGETPSVFLICTILTMALVIFSIIVGIIIKLRELHVDKRKTALSYVVRFFYAVEIPLVLLILYRLFLVRVLTPAMGQILILLLISIGLYFYNLYLTFKDKENTVSHWKLILSTVSFSSSVYISAFILFYIFPPLYYVFQAIQDITIYDILYILNPLHLLQTIIISLIVVSSVVIFATFPFIYLYLHIKLWFDEFMRYQKASSLKTSLITSLVTIFVLISITVLLNIQKQNKYLDLAKFKDTEMSKDDIVNIISNESKIKKNLTNVYLASYRYLSSTGTCSHIENMYSEITGNEKLGKSIQNLYNVIAAPFLYKGKSFVEDKEMAIEIYENLFDEPMQKIQKRKIKNALSSTWNRDEAKAGLLDIDEQIVWLKKQNVAIEESGNFASIEIYEHYENTTTDQQEIFYYFTLPTHSVVTGLWLGETNKKEEAFKYVVSPRGAAQQVYNNQVRVRRDPALIEKVGPTQYRLRAFPIPANSREFKGKKGELHLWLSYAAMRNSDSSWPIPQCREKRNIFWNKKTERSFNEKYFEIESSDKWLPSSLTFANAKKLESIKIDDSTFLTLTPANILNNVSLSNSSKKVAIIIDRSRSMDEYKDYLFSELEKLKEIFGDNKLDIYLGGYSFEKIPTAHKLEKNSVLFIGKTSMLDELNKFKYETSDIDYEMVILLTDDGGYELSDDQAECSEFGYPVHIVHMDNDLPPAYPDNLLETVRKNKGIIAGSIKEFVEKLSSKNSIQSEESLILIDNGYYINKHIEEDVVFNKSKSAKAIAANYLLNNKIQKSDMSIIKNLDFVHSLAKKYSLVTQYSSMIVLVNDRQREELKQAEKREDRFKREVEVGKEELSVPLGADVSGVPEPHEWMLIICITSLACYSLYNKRKTKNGYLNI